MITQNESAVAYLLILAAVVLTVLAVAWSVPR